MTALPRIRFEAPVPIGLALSIDGQRYEMISEVEHVRLDGEQTKLAMWRSECAECGQPFEFRCSQLSLPENRRCELHKQPGKRVRDRARADARPIGN